MLCDVPGGIMESLTMEPVQIEEESFRIIDEEVAKHQYSPLEWPVVRRVIHTSADFEYKETMIFSEDVVSKAIAAIRDGAKITTDTTMVVSGINTSRLADFNCDISCYIGDPDVAGVAKQNKITRSVAAMRKAVSLSPTGIYAIGNAPTALFELLRLMRTGMCCPALIIGLPVGFVGAAESKKALVENGEGQNITPFISNVGRKGGSNVTAAVLNALVLLAK